MTGVGGGGGDGGYAGRLLEDQRAVGTGRRQMEGAALGTNLRVQRRIRLRDCDCPPIRSNVAPTNNDLGAMITRLAGWLLSGRPDCRGSYDGRRCTIQK